MLLDSLESIFDLDRKLHCTFSSTSTTKFAVNAQSTCTFVAGLPALTHHHAMGHHKLWVVQ